MKEDGPLYEIKKEREMKKIVVLILPFLLLACTETTERDAKEIESTGVSVDEESDFEQLNPPEAEESEGCFFDYSHEEYCSKNSVLFALSGTIDPARGAKNASGPVFLYESEGVSTQGPLSSHIYSDVVNDRRKVVLFSILPGKDENAKILRLVLDRSSVLLSEGKNYTLGGGEQAGIYSGKPDIENGKITRICMDSFVPSGEVRICRKSDDNLDDETEISMKGALLLESDSGGMESYMDGRSMKRCICFQNDGTEVFCDENSMSGY